MITPKGTVPVGTIEAPGIIVPEPIAVTVIAVPLIDAVKLAVVAVKQAAMAAKLARNRQFWIDIPAACTLIVVVAPPPIVKVGRISPAPRPMMAQPAWLRARAVAVEMDSLCPGRINSISERACWIP